MLELEDVLGWAVTREDVATVRFDIARLADPPISANGKSLNLVFPYADIDAGKFAATKVVGKVRCLMSYWNSGPKANDLVLYVVTQNRQIVVLGKIGP